MVEYKVIKVLAELSSTTRSKKQLALISWNGNPAKLDLRTWSKSEDGELRPGKGITLTDEEAETLAETLGDYLRA